MNTNKKNLGKKALEFIVCAQSVETAAVSSAAVFCHNREIWNIFSLLQQFNMIK